MATVRYLLQGKSNPTSIYLRFSIERDNTPKRKTGLVIDPKDWSTSTHLPKQNSAENKKLISQLQKLENHLLDRYNDDYASGVQINGDWLTNQINSFFKQGITKNDLNKVVDYIDHFLSTAHLKRNNKGGVGLGKSRVNDYKRLKGIVQEFQGKTPLLIRNVNLKFKDDFLRWLTTDMQFSKGYVGRMLGNLKTICLDAEVNGIETHSQLTKVSGFKVKKDYIIYLTKEELEKIEKADLMHPYLNNTRKWLLFGCCIGQRGNDLMNITKDNFFVRNGLEVIELVQEKTGKSATIPVFPETEEVLKDGLPHKISLAKFNKYVKQVCEIAGVTEMTEGKISKVITDADDNPIRDKNGKTIKREVEGVYPKYQLIGSHTCRRTFCTLQYGILPTPLIMQITMHSSEKVFLSYIGKSGYDYAQLTADFYEKLRKRQKKESNLSIVKDAANQ